jgi:2-polyprenyl-6-methoxyphenol hydroxylase-like FAD-dependent oxidoreductase
MAQHRSEVAVVGAGPVGMMSALDLKSSGIDVQIFDSGRRRAVHSYALVLHADTLQMLEGERLGTPVHTEGRVVQRIGLFEGTRRRGEVDLRDASNPYVLVLPQNRLESILESALERAGVSVHWDHRVQGIEPHATGVRLTVAKLEKVSTGYPVAHTEVVVDKTFDHEAAYVIAADGYDSFVRRRLGIADVKMGKGQIYSVFQFEASGDVPAEGRLMLEPHRVGGYWPLPEGHARFSFPIDLESEHHPETSRLEQLIDERAPWFTGKVGGIQWTAVGLFERKLTSSFGSGRVWLAGDAAHLTGPLGAQSMNVGLREAKELAGAIASALRSNDGGALARYGSARSEEWRSLLSPEPKAGDPRSQIKPCLPASGRGLEQLLDQVRL